MGSYPQESCQVRLVLFNFDSFAFALVLKKVLVKNSVMLVQKSKDNEYD
jgi:hypothetical protein